MATLIVKNLDDDIFVQIKQLARLNGMEFDEFVKLGISNLVKTTANQAKPNLDQTQAFLTWRQEYEALLKEESEPYHNYWQDVQASSDVGNDFSWDRS